MPGVSLLVVATTLLTGPPQNPAVTDELFQTTAWKRAAWIPKP